MAITMVYQIILLPRQDYWEWVRACKEYVLAYGVQLTPDPATAAAFRAPRQVVSFPLAPGGFLEGQDLEHWFRSNHPDVQIDPIDADKPKQLKKALKKRLENQDRFGRKAQPFYLLWPTQYAVITQKFGANPQIYRKFGMPGHEGVDIRALPNTSITACAEGDVYEVHTNPNNHAYGIHVRIRHPKGYRTVYGHLARALVSVGQQVDAGQVIGAADSTGASVGSHLHLTLKRDYATERGETNYPKDVIDPTPFLVWPETSKAMLDYGWVAGRCLIGGYAPSGGALTEPELRAVGLARLEAVRLAQAESAETVHALMGMHPGMFLLARLTAPCGKRKISARQFRQLVEADLGRLYRAGVRHFELHTAPNLQFEGWGHSWADGAEFGRWFAEVADGLRADFPEAKFGFPGVSPGGFVSGQRADALMFLEGCVAAVQLADWIGVHGYWADQAGMDGLTQGRFYEEIRTLYPEKLLMVTESGNLSDGLSPQEAARQYLDYSRSLRDQPGLGAAFTPLLWPPAPAGEEADRAFAEPIGQRDF